MVFKANVAYKEITKNYEVDNEDLVGVLIGDKIKGEQISSELEGYELELKGTSDKAGFPGFAEHKGPNLRKVLLKRGKGMKDKREGVRIRKTLRGNEVSLDTVQLNLLVSKEGKTKASELFKKKEKESEEPKKE
jgi:small subunit ribosomal protein S6e